MKKIKISTCQICGKTLSDPISVMLGIGPDCRIRSKQGLAKERTGSLFQENKPDWEIWGLQEGNIIGIADNYNAKNPTITVTNAIQQVLTELQDKLLKIGKNISDYQIIYRDTLGIWDGVKHKNGKFHSFYSINETDFLKAVKKATNKK